MRTVQDSLVRHSEVWNDGATKKVAIEFLLRMGTDSLLLLWHKAQNGARVQDFAHDDVKIVLQFAKAILLLEEYDGNLISAMEATAAEVGDLNGGGGGLGKPLGFTPRESRALA